LALNKELWGSGSGEYDARRMNNMYFESNVGEDMDVCILVCVDEK